MTMGAAHWDQVYSAKAADSVSWFEASPQQSLGLIARTEAPKSAAIVDVGGGLSRLAGALVEAGYTDVTVLDISAEAINLLLSSQAAGVPVQGLVADVTQWRPARPYAVWHDRAVLHFLTDDDDRDAYRATLDATLAADGQGVIATFAPSGPERCSGLTVRRYGRADLEAFLGGGFSMLESYEFDHATPSGTVQRFHVGRFRRR